MAELADALDSGSNDRKVMEVQVLLPAPANAEPFRFGVFFTTVLQAECKNPKRRVALGILFLLWEKVRTGNEKISDFLDKTF